MFRALVVFDADIGFPRAKAAFDLVEQGRSDSLSRLGAEAARELSGWMKRRRCAESNCSSCSTRASKR